MARNSRPADVGDTVELVVMGGGRVGLGCGWGVRRAADSGGGHRRLGRADGGAIGVELVQAFAGFGTAVTIARAADRLLPGEGCGPAEKSPPSSAARSRVPVIP
jgi:hypothetical protein